MALICSKFLYFTFWNESADCLLVFSTSKLASFIFSVFYLFCSSFLKPWLEINHCFQGFSVLKSRSLSPNILKPVSVGGNKPTKSSPLSLWVNAAWNICNLSSYVIMFLLLRSLFLLAFSHARSTQFLQKFSPL